MTIQAPARHSFESLLGEYCDTCEAAIEVPLLPARPFHVDGSDEICSTSSFYARQTLRMVEPKRYTVIMNAAGFGSGRLESEKPHNANQAATLLEATRMFRTWMIESGNDYRAADGYGQASAEIMLTELWDGISYGDYPWVATLERGIRGGVKIERNP